MSNTFWLKCVPNTYKFCVTHVPMKVATGDDDAVVPSRRRSARVQKMNLSQLAQPESDNGDDASDNGDDAATSESPYDPDEPDEEGGSDGAKEDEGCDGGTKDSDGDEESEDECEDGGSGESVMSTQVDSHEQPEDPNTWGNCQAPPLSDEHMAALPQVLASLGYDVSNNPHLFRFALRVCKEFRVRMSDGDDLDLDRFRCMEDAVEQVMHAVPKVHLDTFSFKSKPGKCAEYFMSVVEKLFSMVAPGPAKGSEEWLDYLRNNIWKATVPDVAMNRVLLNAYVKHERRCNVISKQKLKPPLFPDEAVPDKDYALPVLKDGQSMGTPSMRSTSFAKHPQLPFLRYTYVTAVMRKLRNMDYIPVMISAKEMPNGVAWNNFHKVLHAFRVYYMHCAGYTWDMDIARELLVYLFYGFGPPRVTKRGVKRTPVITVIHKQLTMGRHLFVRNWTKNFESLIRYFDDHPADVR